MLNLPMEKQDRADAKGSKSMARKGRAGVAMPSKHIAPHGQTRRGMACPQTPRLHCCCWDALGQDLGAGRPVGVDLKGASEEITIGGRAAGLGPAVVQYNIPRGATALNIMRYYTTSLQ